jgi:hypothetical protein
LIVEGESRATAAKNLEARRVQARMTPTTNICTARARQPARAHTYAHARTHARMEAVVRVLRRARAPPIRVGKRVGRAGGAGGHGHLLCGPPAAPPTRHSSDIWCVGMAEARAPSACVCVGVGEGPHSPALTCAAVVSTLVSMISLEKKNL